MTVLMILVSVLLALCTSLAWLAVGRDTLGRGIVAVVALSFSYWYLLPAANAFLIGFETDQIEAKWANMRLAFVVTGGFMSITLLAVAVVFGTRVGPSLVSRRTIPHTRLLSRVALGRLSLLTLVSTLGILVSRFSNEGSDVILSIILGATSAREYMEYYNVSSGILASLDGLWEIVNVVTCCLLLCICVAARDSFGSTRMLAAISLFVMFVASGSRSMLIYVLVSILLTRLVRLPVSREPTSLAGHSVWSKRLPVTLLFVAAISSAIASYASRFANYEFGMTSALLGVLVGHNDMLRELAGVIGNMDQYSGVGAFDFCLTPFSFLLPRFLGFDKGIPEHLVLYNQDRMGIDIRYDPGNYFPGIVADFSMVFGFWLGAIAFTGFLLVFFLGIRWLAQSLPNVQTAAAFAASSLALIFGSFRNISGALVLSILILLALSWLTTTRHAVRPLEPNST